MSTWVCARELHCLKSAGKPTPNLKWVRRGYNEDGSIKWRPTCQACEGLSCPRGHVGESIVSLPTAGGSWMPACVTCLVDGFLGDEMRSAPGDAEESERAA